MSIKWTGTFCLVGLFVTFVLLPTALVCGVSGDLLVVFILGVFVSYFLFAATEHHENSPRTSDDHRLTREDHDLKFAQYRRGKRGKAVGFAWLAIAAWVPYVVALLSLDWSGWWWALAIAFFLISVIIVFDLAGTVLLNG